MKKGKIFILIWITLSLFVNLDAREPNIIFQRISIEHGLSQSTVFCILQDSKGFMWFGTEAGLNVDIGTERAEGILDVVEFSYLLINVAGHRRLKTLFVPRTAYKTHSRLSSRP